MPNDAGAAATAPRTQATEGRRSGAARGAAVLALAAALPFMATGCASSAAFTVTSVTVHPDGRLAVGGDDGVVRLCAADGAPTGRLEVAAPVRQVGYSPDGSLLAVVYGTQVRLFRAADRLLVWREDLGAPVDGLAFAPDGDLLATCGPAGVTVWSLRDGRAAVARVIREGHVAHVAFTQVAGRTVLVTASAARLVRLWSASDGELLSWTSSRGQTTTKRYALDPEADVLALACAADGAHLGLVLSDGVAVYENPLTADPNSVWRGWGWEGDQVRRPHADAGDEDDAPAATGVAVAFTADGERAVYLQPGAGWDCVDVRGVRWMLDRSSPLMVLPSEPGATALALAPDGSVVTGGPRGRLTRWTSADARAPAWERSLE